MSKIRVYANADEDLYFDLEAESWAINSETGMLFVYADRLQSKLGATFAHKGWQAVVKVKE